MYFQDVLLKLQEFWVDQGCLIWQPYNMQVGAGTMNPATFLRVLGPEPWNVAYVEPSVRPDDGRYGDNPNRMQYYYQYQVILKPDPGNPQEIYLKSLEALGIDRKKHDIRFVEDNWQQPAIGAWGLGWEVWLDGQEITQFTYFQQVGGQPLNPVSVEITYGVERIALALQGKDSAWDIQWTENMTYRDVFLRSEWEHSTYYFELADESRLLEVFNTYENEAMRALQHEPPLVIPAHDYILKCSHVFNILDTRGAISVIERADFFRRMQRLAARVASAYVDQRLELEYPMLPAEWEVDADGVLSVAPPEPVTVTPGKAPAKPADYLLEIGTEELPADDLNSALEQLQQSVPELLDNVRLDYETVSVNGTPRRLVVYVGGLAPSQRAEEFVKRGPPTRAAFDSDGNPTKAAEGFARSNGVSVADLKVEEIDGGEYVVAHVHDAGRSTAEVLSELLPDLIRGIKFGRTMRWNFSGEAFSRAVRWIVSLHDKAVIPFDYAHLTAGRTTRGTRFNDSPEIELKDVQQYFKVMADEAIILDPGERRELIQQQAEALAKSAGGILVEDEALLNEVTNLVEQPTALLCRFDKDFLNLPKPVLTTVMKKHQRYFAVVDKKGNLLPVFITVRNGSDEHLDSVAYGNEHVIRARFSDARFFYQQDIKQTLSSYVGDLHTLIFQEKLGSYRDKVARIEGLTGRIGSALGMDDQELEQTLRAAHLAKADLTTKMVVEMTSLQGQIGREYALLNGESESIADAIAEHYHPRFAGDSLPQSKPGITIALADRLDSLVGLFSVGLAPTGASDPFALRRAALGVVQILLGHQYDLSLRPLIDWTIEGYTQAMGETFIEPHVADEVMTFIVDRLRVILRESFAHDVVEAVLAEQGHNPYRAHMNANQLTEWVERDNWMDILDEFARCVRITRSQEESFDLSPDDFAEPAEVALAKAYDLAVKTYSDGWDVNALLSAIEPMVPAVSRFFAPEAEGGVLVMHEDQAVRENRLALLQHITALANGIVDLSHLEGF